MQVTIIPDDNIVIVDGNAQKINLSAIRDNIHAIQFNGTIGEIEYKGSAQNEEITDISDYQYYIDQHNELYQAEIDPFYGKTEQEKKDIAFTMRLNELDSEYKTLLGDTFEYNGHNYYSDFKFIAGVFLGLTSGELPGDYTENWKTADKEPDGVTNIYTILDKSGIIGLGLAYLESQKIAFQSIDPRKTVLKELYSDESKTYQDIINAEV